MTERARTTALWTLIGFVLLAWTLLNSAVYIRTFVLTEDQQTVAPMLLKIVQPELFSRDYFFAGTNAYTWYPAPFLLPLVWAVQGLSSVERAFQAMHAVFMLLYTAGTVALLRLIEIRWYIALGTAMLSSIVHRLAITGSYWGIGVVLNLTLYTALIPAAGVLALVVGRRWGFSAGWVVLSLLVGLGLNVHSVSGMGGAFMWAACTGVLLLSQRIPINRVLATGAFFLVGASPFLIDFLAPSTAAPAGPDGITALREIAQRAASMVYPWPGAFEGWPADVVEPLIGSLFIGTVLFTVIAVLYGLARRQWATALAVMTISACILFSLLGRSGALCLVPAAVLAAQIVRKRPIPLTDTLLLTAFAAAVAGGPMLQAVYRYLLLNTTVTAFFALTYETARNLSLAYAPLFALLAVFLHSYMADEVSPIKVGISLLTLGFAFHNANQMLTLTEDTIALTGLLLAVILWPRLAYVRQRVFIGILCAGAAVLAARATGFFHTPLIWPVMFAVGMLAAELSIKKQRSLAYGVMLTGLALVLVLPAGRIHWNEGMLLAQIPQMPARIAGSLQIYQTTPDPMLDAAAWASSNTPENSLFWYAGEDCRMFRYYSRRSIIVCENPELSALIYAEGVSGYNAKRDLARQMTIVYREPVLAEQTAQTEGIDYIVYRNDTSPTLSLPVVFQDDEFTIYEVR